MLFKEKWTQAKKDFRDTFKINHDLKEVLEMATMKMKTLREENQHLLDLIIHAEPSLADISSSDEDDDGEHIHSKRIQELLNEIDPSEVELTDSEEEENETARSKQEGEVDGEENQDDEDENAFLDRLDVRIREVISTSKLMQEATALLDQGFMGPRPIPGIPGAIAVGSGSVAVGAEDAANMKARVSLAGFTTWQDPSQAGLKRKDIASESEDDAAKAKKKPRRDNRQAARNVRILPRDENGNLLLPCTIGKGAHEVTILRLGQVIPDREGFHNARYIFPLGYTSRKEFPSPIVPGKKTWWTSTILDSPTGSVFQVTPNDSPSLVFKGNSAGAVWKDVVQYLFEKGHMGKTSASGPELYGLSDIGIMQCIQELPRARECTKYHFQQWVETPEEIQEMIEKAKKKPEGMETMEALVKQEGGPVEVSNFQ